MDLLVHVAVALGLGLLVGLQREWAGGQVAGVRTFPLIAVLGVLCGALGASYGGWIVAAGLAGLAALIVTGDVIRMRTGDLDPGITTEVAGLVTFTLGVMVSREMVTEAVVIGGAMAVLLHLKPPMHRLVDRFGEAELTAVIRLVLIALVVLPILPNEAYGPYQILNPREIWLMVVLIVGISMIAYGAHRLLGPRRGTLAAGVLGGLISSTATTVSQARREEVEEGDAAAGALVIVVASTVVFARVFIEVAVVHPTMLGSAAPPLLSLAAVMVGISIWGYLRDRDVLGSVTAEREPPSRLGTAVAFGLLYAGVMVAAAAARSEFGTGGLYAVAAISGLTDVDAITISTAQLVRDARVETGTGWRMIVLGTLSNLVFKGGLVVALARSTVWTRVVRRFAVGLVAGGLILWFWPG